MALADFGVNAGLTDQQIVDLTIHHRWLHGQERRTRLDYFQRTISKARNAVRPGALFGVTLPPAGEEASGDRSREPDSSFESGAKKAMLCQHISQLLGIRLLRMVRLAGRDPVYLMELEDGLIEFPDVSKLIYQKSLGLALAAKVGRVMRKFTSNEWRQVAQMLLDACVDHEGTDELDYKGATRIYISQYLSDVGLINSLEGQSGQNLRKPVIHDGKIAISSIDLQMYINKTTLQTLSVKARHDRGARRQSRPRPRLRFQGAEPLGLAGCRV
jgi:hypothetical protein